MLCEMKSNLIHTNMIFSVVVCASVWVSIVWEEMRWNCSVLKQYEGHIYKVMFFYIVLHVGYF